MTFRLPAARCKARGSADCPLQDSGGAGERRPLGVRQAHQPLRKRAQAAPCPPPSSCLPLAAAAIRTCRRSAGTAPRLARPATTKASTSRLIAVGVTCSASASDASDWGPVWLAIARDSEGTLIGLMSEETEAAW